MSDTMREPLARLIETELKQLRETELPRLRRPLVAITRDYGCGGEEIGHQLAEALEVPWFDRDLIERVAKAARTDKAAMAALDETVKGPLEVWVTSLLAQQSFSPSEYLHHLVRVLMGIARHGGVIMGRGSHVILKRQHPFRVRLVGTPEKCAERVALAEGLSERAAEAKVKQKNRERALFLWEDFHVRTNEPLNYDILINTDGFADLGQVVEILRSAYHAFAASVSRAAV
ncbi:MAG: cytidylate kinase-like family protein [Rhodospirillaceae bacterium]|nr:cytidylate kinase-like family protein [Rhodospirillaceae bacterium]